MAIVSGASPGARAADARVSLRRAGRRLDLVVGGVSYSSWHPDRPWTGYVWDALAAASAFARSEPDVLLLGAGAGTVLALLRRLRPHARLVAVELDEGILAIARERFGLDDVGAELVVGDGCEFLERTRRRFDLVLDDMFAPGPDGLRRPVGDEAQHLRRIAARLAAGGIAATNVTTDGDPPGLEGCVARAHAAVFPHSLRLEPARGWNAVLVSGRSPLATDAVRRLAKSLGSEDSAGLLGVRTRRR
jgi:spermidine synthase